MGEASPRTGRMLAAAALAFAAIRLLLWALAGPVSPVADDQLEYLGLRESLLAHGQLLSPFTHVPTAFRDPGWPAVLALIALIAGRSIPAIVLAQVLLQSLTGVLLVDVSRRCSGTRAAVLTAVLFGLHLSFATYTLFVYSESLATLALASFAWGWCVLGGRARPGGAVAAGLLAGALALVRASALPLPPAFAAGEAGVTRGRVRAYLLATLAAAVVLGAWCARNHAVVGTFSPNTNAAVNLWIGNSPGTPIVHGYRAMTDSAVWAPLAGLNEAQRASRALALAAAEIRARPGMALLRALARVPDALEPDRIFLGVARRGQFSARSPRLLTVVGMLIALVTFVPTTLALSAVLAPPASAFARGAAAAFVVALIVQVLTIAHARFTLPAWMLLLPGAALAWDELRERSRARLVATAVSGLILAAIALRQLVLR